MIHRALARAREAVGWLRVRMLRGALVLLYHRVAEIPTDPHGVCVTPRDFADHLEIIRKRGRPLPLRALCEAISCGDVAPRSLVVTFDDGYADNLLTAKPLLERYEIPATVFVTSGLLGGSREFWWDELDRLVLQPGTLPPQVRLNVRDGRVRFTLGDAARYTDEAFHRHRSWNTRVRNAPTSRQRFFRLLYRLLYRLPTDERQRVLEELRALAGAPPEGRATHRLLDVPEVLRLAGGGLVEIGAHTVRHPVLSTLPASAQRAEIRDSKARLEEILGRPVLGFAYPYGMRSDYTAQTVEFVREAGFAHACSNFTDVVRPRADLFQLPRVAVRAWDGDAFLRALGPFFRE